MKKLEGRKSLSVCGIFNVIKNMTRFILFCAIFQAVFKSLLLWKINEILPQISLVDTTSSGFACETVPSARKCSETSLKVNYAPTVVSSSREKLFRTVRIWVIIRKPINDAVDYNFTPFHSASIAPFLSTKME